MNQTNGSVLGLLTLSELAQAGLLGILDHVKTCLGGAIILLGLIHQGCSSSITRAGC